MSLIRKPPELSMQLSKETSSRKAASLKRKAISGKRGSCVHRKPFPLLTCKCYLSPRILWLTRSTPRRYDFRLPSSSCRTWSCHYTENVSIDFCMQFELRPLFPDWPRLPNFKRDSFVLLRLQYTVYFQSKGYSERGILLYRGHLLQNYNDGLLVIGMCNEDFMVKEHSWLHRKCPAYQESTLHISGFFKNILLESAGAGNKV